MRPRKLPVINHLEITNMSTEGIAYGWSEQGKKIYVENGVIGDICDVKIYKREKGSYTGKAIYFHKRSDLRLEPICPHFGLCGGCRWQFVSYEQQLLWKQELVQELFDIPIPPVLPAPQTLFYRNKLEFSATNDRWVTELESPELTGNKSVGEAPEANALGFHVPHRWAKIFQVDTCYLQPDPSNSLRLAIKEIAEELGITFYNPVQQIGTLRNVTIRTSSTGQVMVIIAFYPDQLEQQIALLSRLYQRFPTITSLYSVQNAKGNDSIYDCELSLFAGQPYIMEKIGDLSFAITPKSFFQVNTSQAERLFQLVLEFAQLNNNETVYDLYCGTGAISLTAARHSQKVVGIELIADAIRDAKFNAELNNITNVEFITGDLQTISIPNLVCQYGQPDVVITDPPRSGMTNKVIAQLLTIAPAKIIYVSCNPVTQARDVKNLLHKYHVRKIQPLDMFPQTAHVENVLLLEAMS